MHIAIAHVAEHDGLNAGVGRFERGLSRVDECGNRRDRHADVVLDIFANGFLRSGNLLAQPPQVFGLRETVGDDGLLDEVLLQQLVQRHEA